LLGKTLIDDSYNFSYVEILLVEIDVSLGPYESMDFVMGGRKYSQIIYYQNIPFRCTRCHAYDHVHKDCEKVWWKKEISAKNCGREGNHVELIQKEDSK
jgi:hypothetical protein